VIVPDIGPLVSLVGSVGFSLLGLIIPVAMETVWFWYDEDGDGQEQDSCDGTTLKTNHESWARGNMWRRIVRHMKNAILLLFATLALVGGAFYNIRDIIAKATGDGTPSPAV